MLGGFVVASSLTKRREMVVDFDPNNFTELVCDLESKDKTEEPEGIELPCLSLGFLPLC